MIPRYELRSRILAKLPPRLAANLLNAPLLSLMSALIEHLESTPPDPPPRKKRRR